MFDAIARVLAFFYSLPVVGGSVGYAIILLTAAVMMLLMPLTLRATRSTIKMQEVQPQLKELQKKYKDDRQTLNQEMMALYSSNGINPVGGCLPMLAQLPVFLVLFNVLRGLSRRVSETPYFAVANEARARSGADPIPGEVFDPRYLSTDSDLYQDLSVSSEIGFGPFDLGLEAWDVIQDNFLTGIPYVLLILFVVATSYYQQRQVSSRRGGGMGMNPQQEMILRFLPVLSGVWSFVFPAGLVLYWATSNVFRIGQQSYITRRYYGAEGEGAAGASGGDDDDDDDEDSSSGSSSAGAGAKAKAAKAGAKGSAATATKTATKSGAGKGKGEGKGKASGAATSDGGAGDGADGDSTTDGAEANGSGGGSSSNGKSAKGSADKGSESTNGEAPAKGDAESRNEAWERRRRQRAKTQAATKNRREQSSRVTPKGTKPGGSRKKRKR